MSYQKKGGRQLRPLGTILHDATQFYSCVFRPQRIGVHKVSITSGPRSALPGSDVATIAACQTVVRQYAEEQGVQEQGTSSGCQMNMVSDYLTN